MKMKITDLWQESKDDGNGAVAAAQRLALAQNGSLPATGRLRWGMLVKRAGWVTLAALLLFPLLLPRSLHAQFDGALVTRTTSQQVFSGDVIVWQQQSYEEGGNWWRKHSQPARFYVVDGVSKVRLRFSVALAGTATGRLCAFTVVFKANGKRIFVPGNAAICVNADQIGTTELQVHSAAIPVQPGDYFEFAVNIHPGSLAPLTAVGGFGITWAAIEKVE